MKSIVKLFKLCPYLSSPIQILLIRLNIVYNRNLSVIQIHARSSYTITKTTLKLNTKKKTNPSKRETLFLLRLLLRFLRYTPKPIKEDRTGDIECNIHEQKTKVAPSLAIIRADTCQERIRVRKRAERAISCCIFVKKISTSSTNIIL